MSLVSAPYRWQYSLRQWYAGRLCSLRRPVRAPFVAVPTPNRVLMVVAGLLGDTVMCTPLIVEARRLWPGASITVLGQRHNCELLSACPLIDACVETPAIPFSFRKRRQIAQLKRWLEGKGFDLAILALGDQFAKLLSDVEIPIRVGVGGRPLAPYLTHTYEIGSPHAWGPFERLNALRALGLAVREPRARLWVSNGSPEAARRKLQGLGLPEHAPYAAVHVFGNKRCKWWPPDRLDELAHGLRSEHGLRTVAIGGVETQRKLPKSARGEIIDATGALSIECLLGVLKNANLVISTDSGPFHIAGALARPLIGLFRARRPEHANRYPQARIAFGRGSCSEIRCQGDSCRTSVCPQLNALSVAGVLSAVRLSQHGDSASLKRVS